MTQIGLTITQFMDLQDLNVSNVTVEHFPTLCRIYERICNVFGLLSIIYIALTNNQIELIK